MRTKIRKYLSKAHHFIQQYRLLACFLLVPLAALLGGCAPGSIPIGPNEMLPMTRQQIVTGAYQIYTGQQLWYWEFLHTSGLKVFLWPGATTGKETLVNMICVKGCVTGWESIVSGYAMTARKASDIAANMRNSQAWQEVTAAAPAALAWAARMYAGIATGGTTEFMAVPAGFQMLFPENPQL